MSKHTPGPWRFEPAPDGGFDIEKDPNDLGRYMVIASRAAHPNRAEEMHANARLIAAAPELLAFVEEYIDAWKEGMAGDSYLLRLAEKARLNATGEKQ